MMHDLSEQVEEAMRVLSSLSNSARMVGSDSVYCAANRAWHELNNTRTASKAQEKA